LFNLTLNNGADFVDFLSRNAFSEISGTESSSPGTVSLSYSLSTDDKGRLAKMTSSAGVSTGTILYSYY
jgi:hypothetical protein